MRPRPDDTNHFNPPDEKPTQTEEESLVSDARAGLTPSDMVEQRLVSLLQSPHMTVARLQSSSPHRPVA
jgi:hypothetical protein